MYNFCYISYYKVEQYLPQIAQMGDQMPGQQIAQISVSESSKKAEGKLGLFTRILSLGGTYGRSDKIETRSERRTTLVEKLLILIKSLYAGGRVGLFPTFKSALDSSKFDMYFLRTAMRVESHNDQIAILKCESNG